MRLRSQRNNHGSLIALTAAIAAVLLLAGKEGSALAQSKPPSPSKAVATDWKKIPVPPLREFSPQKPKRLELANGMVVFLQEDRSLPLISGFARVRGGSLEEPAGKAGLVAVLGQAWRTGGTRKRTGDELDDFLEMRAAKVETDGGTDGMSIQFSCLKEDFEATFLVCRELLQEPEFRQEKIDIAKESIKAGISRRNDEIMEIADREAGKLAFGADHPAARQVEFWTLASIVREDLVAWHQSHVFPDRILLGLVGDFDAAAMESRIREAFEGWPRGSAYRKPELAWPPTRPGIFFIPKEDVNQSAIRLVQLGTLRNNPDYYALTVMNEIFGGGFSSRLFSHVRSKKGFAYEVGGGVGMGWDAPGIYRLFLGTQSEKTARAIDALYEEVDRMTQAPCTAEELKLAKESILNSFIFRYDSREKILLEQMNLEWHGYPLDFTDRFRAGVEKVSAEDVARVSRKYLNRSGFAVLVVGRARDFDRPLSGFGTVRTLDIAIRNEPPASGSSLPEIPTAGLAEGKEIAVRVVNALGGQERLKEIAATRIKGARMLKTPQGDFQGDTDVIIQYPSRMVSKVRMPSGEITTVATGEKAFMIMGGMVRDFSAGTRDSILKELGRDTLFICQNLENPRFSFALAGREKIGDLEAVLIDVDAGGTQTRWFVDPETFRIVRSSYQGLGASGPVHRVVDYADWKNFQGIILPARYTSTEDGKEAGWTEIREVEFNPAIEPRMFEKP